MIIQDIYIKRAKWHVRIYHAVDAMFATEICEDLASIGCSGKDLIKASDTLKSGCVDQGLTYSNLNTRESVMVIGITSNAGEYWNTIDHERNHILQHISQACDLDIYGEEISYISGEFIRDVYNSPAKKLLCDCCRNSIRNRHNTKMFRTPYQ